MIVVVLPFETSLLLMLEVGGEVEVVRSVVSGFIVAFGAELDAGASAIDNAKKIFLRGENFTKIENFSCRTQYFSARTNYIHICVWFCNFGKTGF